MYLFSLVKQGAIHTGKGKVIPKEDLEELLTAEEVLQGAKVRAEEIILEAEKEAVEIKKRAQEEGYQEGLTKFNQHLIFFDDKVKQIKVEMQKAMLPLVLKSTKRIVGEALEESPELIVDVVMQAIKTVLGCHEIKIFVNRADRELLEGKKEKIKILFERLESFRIEERPDIERGSCIIETERGIINATLENQYRALERAFEAFKK